jgi:hypothetical protein
LNFLVCFQNTGQQNISAVCKDFLVKDCQVKRNLIQNCS